MKERSRSGYDSFIGYVDRLIRHPPTLDSRDAPSPGQAGSKANESITLPSAAKQQGTPPATKPANPSGFTFNPAPRKEDLI